MRALHKRSAPKQLFRSYTNMVITHKRLPGLSKRGRNFGLQSFLLCSSFLMENILEQIRPSQSQWFRFLLNRFYPSQDGFSAWNRTSKFKRTSLVFSLFRVRNQEKIRRTPRYTRTPYISAVNRLTFTHMLHCM